MSWSLPSWKKRVLLDQPTKASERAAELPLFALGPVRALPAATLLVHQPLRHMPALCCPAQPMPHLVRPI